MIGQTVLVWDVDSTDKKKIVFEEPTECPLCHHAIRPDMKDGYYVRSKSETGYAAYVPCFCANCRRLFFAKYCGIVEYGGFSTPHLLSVFPAEFQPATFGGAVSELSPIFVKTYNEALNAETQGLTEICGLGYRKALEFLVKDYLIHKTPDDAERIKKELLGVSIKRLEDPRIKTLAERSVWIGNDETHYIRKHEDLDYADMKRFVRAMVHYVDTELTFEEALGISAK